MHTGSASATMILRAQRRDARARIEQLIKEGFQDYTQEGVIHVSIAAPVVSGSDVEVHCIW